MTDRDGANKKAKDELAELEKSEMKQRLTDVRVMIFAPLLVVAGCVFLAAVFTTMAKFNGQHSGQQRLRYFGHWFRRGHLAQPSRYDPTTASLGVATIAAALLIPVLLNSDSSQQTVSSASLKRLIARTTCTRGLEKALPEDDGGR